VGRAHVSSLVGDSAPWAVETRRAKRYMAKVIYMVAACVVLGFLVLFPKWTVEDAWITFRYADNLANHGALTFNVGEDPVEGYTGILLPLLVALGIKAGCAPDTASHIVGVVSFIACLLICDALLRRLRVSAVQRAWSLLLMGTAPIMYIHACGGLETMLFAAVLLASAYLLHAVASGSYGDARYHTGLSVALLLTALTRPEGAGFAAIAIAAVLILHRCRGGPFRLLVPYGALFVFPGAVYFLWRWTYYGHLLPNTFYAKQAASLSGSTLQSSYLFLRQYLVYPAICALLPCLVYADELLQAVRRSLARGRGEEGMPLQDGRTGSQGAQRISLFMHSLTATGVLCLCFLLFGLLTMAVYLRSELVMNFSYRFYVPFFPLGLLVLNAGMREGFGMADQRREARPVARGMLVVLCLMLVAMQVAHQVKWFFQQTMPSARGQQTRLEEMHIPAGKYLRSVVPSNEWLVVYVDAGAMPFFSRLKTVDCGNLNDEYLATGNPSAAARIDYVFARHPGAMVFASFNWDYVDFGREADAILRDPRFEDYCLARKYTNSTPARYFQFVFLRKDLIESSDP
jgi:hypothetical protein